MKMIQHKIPQLFIGGLCFLISPVLLAQTNSSDTLQEVVVKAYGQNSSIRNIPAAINHIGSSTLQLFGPVSVVQAINSTPGVRMEERSPGSYRFNVRGSSLRSPFGVRNVKVYYNDLPITDPGGNTYLNQLGYYNFHSIDIIKGPGSSFYGSGTGGVLLIESLDSNEKAAVLSEYATGSYGLQNIYGSITTVSEKQINRIGFQHQESNGYRDHSRLKRQVHSWNGLFRIGEDKIVKTTFLFGNLFYETPGALTKVEFDANPQSARPGTGPFPGAIDAKASITQKTFIVGASYEQPLFHNWQNKSTLYGMFTELRNPAIQNYGRNSEPHLGGRTVFRFDQPLGAALLHVNMGLEFQEGYTTISIFKNVNGSADSLRTYDEINNRQSFVFTQASLDYNSWTFTAGASLNFLRVRLERFAPASLGLQKRTFGNQVAPRLAILKKLGRFNVYASVAKGFSPPSTAELAPTGGAVNLDLNAERGINYDAGIKGNLLKNLYIDVNAFTFSLENTIVQRRTAGGSDYYINAGKTRQQGIETYLSYPLSHPFEWIDKTSLWLSHAWHNFHYRDFKQLNNDFSGNRLPSEAQHTVSTGLDFFMKKGIQGSFSYYFSSKIPLNDANTAFANAYHLVATKLGYEKGIGARCRTRITVGVDNLLNQKYSLGNDINGFGGRYYNAAPGRNYYVSLQVQLLTKGNG